MRVFIGIGEIAGYYSRLIEGLERCGHKCTLVGATFDSRSYLRQESSLLLGFWIKLSMLKGKNRFSRMFFFLPELAVRVICLFWCLFIFDVFIIGYGRSFFGSKLDLAIMRGAGKRVIVNIGHGSDSRPPYLDGARLKGDGSPQDASEYLRLIEDVYRNVKLVEKYASVVIGNPVTCHFLERDFISILKIGLPVSVPDVGNCKRNNNVPRVLHAPSFGPVKGTHIVREAVADLQRKGVNFEYVELQGVANSVVLEELIKTDILVDQALAQTPLGGLGAEAACFGVPCIIGGYQLDKVVGWFYGRRRKGSFCCKPNEIAASIERLIRDRALREEIGNAAREFVCEEWNIDAVAQRYDRIIRDDIEPEWVEKADRVNDVYGNLEIEKRKEIIRSIVQQYGKDALRLSGNKSLERRVLLAAGIDSRR